MKIDKEQILIFGSVGFLLVMTFLSMIYMRVLYHEKDEKDVVELSYANEQLQGENISEAHSEDFENDNPESEDTLVEFTSWSGYYRLGQLEEGDVLQANAAHADCFVMLKETHEQSDAMADAEGQTIDVRIFYNDEFVLPEYSSLDFANAVKDFLVVQNDMFEVSVSKSDDENLKNAMEPAILITMDVVSDDFQRLINDCFADIFEKAN